MVNLRDYTSGQELRILLNLEDPAIRCHDDLLENGIRLAYTLAGEGVRQGIPVSLRTNGIDLVTGTWEPLAGTWPGYRWPCRLNPLPAFCGRRDSSRSPIRPPSV